MDEIFGDDIFYNEGQTKETTIFLVLDLQKE